MWFAVALLVFSWIYAGLRLLQRKTPKNDPDAELPGDAQVIGLSLLIGASTFLVRIAQPLGTSILNMQLCYFPQYVALFCVGIIVARRNWLLRFSYVFGWRWFKRALLFGTVGWVSLVFLVVQTHTEDRLSGGFTWQSAALSFWESFFCVGICLGLLVLFRERFTNQNRLMHWLGDNSFSVYLFHTPILIAITLILRDFAAPKLVKCLCATVLGVVCSYVASGFLLRRVPMLKRVL